MELWHEIWLASLVAGAGIGIAYLVLKPRIRGWETDVSHGNEYVANDTIPYWMVFIWVATIHNFLGWWTGFGVETAVFTMVCNLMVMMVCQRWIARPRPDYITRPSHEKVHGLTSFPSGHSSNMFACNHLAALIVTRYWLASWPTQAFQLTMCTLYGTALMVAISRIYDHRHHISDITVGALQGILVAHWVFHGVCQHEGY